MQKKIIQDYKDYSVCSGIECYDKDTVSFAAGSDHVVVSHTQVEGWNFIPNKSPTKVNTTVIT